MSFCGYSILCNLLLFFSFLLFWLEINFSWFTRRICKIITTRILTCSIFLFFIAFPPPPPFLTIFSYIFLTSYINFSWFARTKFIRLSILRKQWIDEFIRGSRRRNNGRFGLFGFWKYKCDCFAIYFWYFPSPYFFPLFPLPPFPSNVFLAIHYLFGGEAGWKLGYLDFGNKMQLLCNLFQVL